MVIPSWPGAHLRFGRRSHCTPDVIQDDKRHEAAHQSQKLGHQVHPFHLRGRVLVGQLVVHLMQQLLFRQLRHTQEVGEGLKGRFE